MPTTPKTLTHEELRTADNARGDKFLANLAAASERRDSGHRRYPRPTTPPRAPEFPRAITIVGEVRDAILLSRAASADTEALIGEIETDLDARLLASDLRDEAQVTSLSRLLAVETLAKRKLELVKGHLGQIPELERELLNKFEAAKRALTSLAERLFRYRLHAHCEEHGFNAGIERVMLDAKTWFSRITALSQPSTIEAVRVLVERAVENFPELTSLIEEYGLLDWDLSHDPLLNRERMTGGGIADPRGTPRQD